MNKSCSHLLVQMPDAPSSIVVEASKLSETLFDAWVGKYDPEALRAFEKIYWTGVAAPDGLDCDITIEGPWAGFFARLRVLYPPTPPEQWEWVARHRQSWEKAREDDPTSAITLYKYARIVESAETRGVLRHGKPAAPAAKKRLIKEVSDWQKEEMQSAEKRMRDAADQGAGTGAGDHAGQTEVEQGTEPPTKAPCRPQ